MHSEPTPTLSREATRAAYARHVVGRTAYLNDADTWGQLADQFAVDATYFDSFFGLHQGRERIRAFLRDSMAGLGAWQFPVQWVEVGEGRVVVHLRNIAPGTRADGSAIEFPSVSIIEYNAAGEIAHQMDLYDRLAAVRTASESRGGRPVQWTLALLQQLSGLGPRVVQAVYNLTGKGA